MSTPQFLSKVIRNQQGIAHYLAPAVVVLLIAVIGTFALVSSNANSRNTVKTGKVAVRSYQQSAASSCQAPPSKVIKDSPDLYKAWKNLCRVTKAKNVAVYVQTRNSEQGCRSKNGTKLNYAKDGGILNLGPSTVVTCSPGTYTFTLAKGKDIRKETNPNGIIAANNFEVTVVAKKTQVINLGTERQLGK